MDCGEGEAVSDAEKLTDELVTLRHAIDQLELIFSVRAAAFASTNEYEGWGAATPIDWIRLHCHTTGPVAADRVAVGQHMANLPQTLGAMLGGDIGFGHVTVMARTANALSNSDTARAFDESALLPKAIENSVGKFHHICRHARHAADPNGFAAGQADLVENRSLTLSTWDDGAILINGLLDPAGGAAVRSALEPLARLSGAGDDRNRDRRMADALVDLAMHALDNGLVPQTASQRTHLQVTTSLGTLLGLDGSPAAEMEFALPISSKTVERLACDCSVTRILLDSDSMIIDVGRAKRVVTGPTRKALNVRDGHCTWPGCERPATWTAAHHLVHWILGGRTNLPNLVLLCHRHHWMVHEGKWQLVRCDDGHMLTIPPTVTFGPSPRGPD